MARVIVQFKVKDHKGKISDAREIVETYRALPTQEEVEAAVREFVIDNYNTRDLRASFVSLDSYTIIFHKL